MEDVADASTAERPAGLPSAFVAVSAHASGGRPASGAPVAAWLLDEGRRLPRLGELVDEFCWRLNQEGLPIWRSTLHLGTLHPQLRAFAVRWWRDDGRVEELRVRHGIEETGAYRDSPVPLVMERGEIIRRRITASSAAEFPILAELQTRGGTDYVAMPLAFSTGRRQCITFAASTPDGFGEHHIARLLDLAPLLATVLEVYATKRVASDLLGIYLGRKAGARVLDGVVRLGQAERIHAAILVADMRGFSAMSEQLPGESVIAELNQLFACIVEPIHARGGEVLKFLGDGLIAAFPTDGSCAPNEPASCALIAAQEALNALDAVNLRRSAQAVAPLRAGIALHVGEVLFGNVGTPDRLDFTAIGPAVNFAARLEALNKTLGAALIASFEFAAECSLPLCSLGFHRVPGRPSPLEIFGIRPSD